MNPLVLLPGCFLTIKHPETLPRVSKNICRHLPVTAIMYARWCWWFCPQAFTTPVNVHTPPKCTQVCLHLGLYVCICNGVCCVSQGLSWLFHQRDSGALRCPMCGHKCGKRELPVLVSLQRGCYWKGLLVAKPGAPALAPLRTHSADSGGLAPTQAGYQHVHHGTTFEQTAVLTSRCDIQGRSLRQLEWLGFFLKTFCLLSRRLLQFRLQSFKCCFSSAFPGVLISCFWPFLSLIVHLISLQVSWCCGQMIKIADSVKLSLFWAETFLHFLFVAQKLLHNWFN